METQSHSGRFFPRRKMDTVLLMTWRRTDDRIVPFNIAHAKAIPATKLRTMLVRTFGIDSPLNKSTIC